MKRDGVCWGGGGEDKKRLNTQTEKKLKQRDRKIERGSDVERLLCSQIAVSSFHKFDTHTVTHHSLSLYHTHTLAKNGAKTVYYLQ